MSLPNTIVIDLDGTLTVDNKSVAYEHKPENKEIVSAVKKAKAQGYQVTIATSRNMRTFNGDVEKIKQYTQPLIETWLFQKEIPYDNLIVGKPWCGPMGFYVDDKNVHLEEFIFRFNSDFAGQKMDAIKVLSSCSAFPASCDDYFRLSRLFDMSQLVYLTSFHGMLPSTEFPIQYYYDKDILAALKTYLRQTEADYVFFESLPIEMSLFKLLYPQLDKLNSLKNQQGFKITFFTADSHECKPMSEPFFYGLPRIDLSSCAKTAQNLRELLVNLDNVTHDNLFTHVLAR